MTRTSTTSSWPEALNETAAWLVGGGTLTFMVAPLALPLIFLTVVAVLPFLLVPLVLGVVAAVVAAPVVAIRALWRKRPERRQFASRPGRGKTLRRWAHG